jgi:hypothetical protein
MSFFGLESPKATKKGKGKKKKEIDYDELLEEKYKLAANDNLSLLGSDNESLNDQTFGDVQADFEFKTFEQPKKAVMSLDEVESQMRQQQNKFQSPEMNKAQYRGKQFQSAEMNRQYNTLEAPSGQYHSSIAPSRTLSFPQSVDPKVPCNTPILDPRVPYAHGPQYPPMNVASQPNPQNSPAKANPHFAQPQFSHPPIIELTNNEKTKVFDIFQKIMPLFIHIDVLIHSLFEVGGEAEYGNVQLLKQMKNNIKIQSDLFVRGLFILTAENAHQLYQTLVRVFQYAETVLKPMQNNLGRNQRSSQMEGLQVNQNPHQTLQNNLGRNQRSSQMEGLRVDQNPHQTLQNNLGRNQRSSHMEGLRVDQNQKSPQIRSKVDESEKELKPKNPARKISKNPSPETSDADKPIQRKAKQVNQNVTPKVPTPEPSGDDSDRSSDGLTSERAISSPELAEAKVFEETEFPALGDDFPTLDAQVVRPQTKPIQKLTQKQRKQEVDKTKQHAKPQWTRLQSDEAIATDSLKIPQAEKYRGMMQKHEKELIAKIQISQLVTDTPFIDDYYFQMHTISIKQPEKKSKRKSKKSEKWQNSENQFVGKSSGQIISNQMQQQMRKLIETKKSKPREHTLIIEGSLGKIRKFTNKTMKEAIQIVPLKRNENSSGRSELLALKHCEKLYDFVLRYDELERKKSEDDQNDEDEELY